MGCHTKSLIYFPIVSGFFVVIGTLTCYGIAVSLGHVEKFPSLAFISDTGAKPPESSIFTLILMFGVVAMFLSIFYFYKYVEHFGYNTKCNKAALVIGCFVCFGGLVVGAFRETDVPSVHIAGAALTCFSAVVYGWLLALMTCKYTDLYRNARAIKIFRIVFSCLQTIAGIIFLVFYILQRVNEKEFRSYAVVSEWVVIYLVFAMNASLSYDLNNVKTNRSTLLLYSEEIQLLKEDEEAEILRAGATPSD